MNGYVIIHDNRVYLKDLHRLPQEACDGCGSWQECAPDDPGAEVQEHGQWFKLAGYSQVSLTEVVCDYCGQTYRVHEEVEA